MKKRLLSFVLTICMVFAMMPAMGITASAAGETHVYVGDTSVSLPDSGNTTYSNTNSSDSTWWVSNSGGSYTLTLNNAVITTNYASASTTAAIYADCDLNIVLQGNNTAVGLEDTSRSSCGIYTDGTVNISGIGALTAKGGKTNGASVVSCGVYGKTGVSINGEAAVTALGGTATTTSGNTSCGIYGPASISGGKVVALGGAANTSDNTTNGMSYGIYAVNPDTICYTGGLLVAKGGKATTCQAINYAAKDGDDDAVAKSGAYSSKYVVYDKNNTYTVLTTNQTPLTNCTLSNTIIVGEDTTRESLTLNIPSGGTLSLEGFNVVLGGDVTGTGVNYAVYGSGLMTIEGNGALVTIGGTTNGYGAGISCGWDARSHLNITGGIITAIGGAAGSDSTGVSKNSAFSLSGGHLTAIGGACGNNGYSDSIGVGVHPYTNFSGNAKGIAIGDSQASYSFYSTDVPLGAELTSGAWDGKIVAWKGLPKSATPAAATTTVSKTVTTQASVSFALTNSPAYANGQTWGVYSHADSASTVAGVTASNTGNTLTLTHATDVPAGTYYLAVTETGKYESYRLALTVANMPTVVSTSAITGVTPPVAGSAPVTTITECNQYTGTVTWTGSPATFSYSTVYTATITLTPKTGYTLTGVAANFFSVAGATGVSNSADSGVVTAVFPATAAAPPPGGGGSSSKGSTPALVTKIESGENVTGTNVDKLVAEKKSLTVEGKAGEKLLFDTEALKNIVGQTKDSVKVEIKDVSADYKNEHPDRLVVSLSITAGEKHITGFGNGIATVSLPYELKAGEKAEDVTVWYLAEDGTMTEVPCTYDPVTKLATFKVSHFSLYVVGTADTGKWINPFSDVKESSWYYDAVRYVSANGLMQGTEATTFNPRAKTTRGMIVTILWRMENEPKAAKEITFTDVKNGKYYHDAVAWASEKGIVGGYSAEQFGPEDNITREQLAVILHNYVASKGYKTDTTADLSVFSDSGKIHKWGKDAVSWANAEGLINGTGSNLLDPLGAAERCQVAAILQRFVEKTVK